MMAALKMVGTPPANTNIGWFCNYKLQFSDVAFTIVQFTPHHSDARETLSKIESPQGEKLFHAKDHLQARGSLIFLREIDAAWVVYRLIGMPRHPHVNAVWLVTEKGVSSPEVEQAIDFKQAIAELEGCEVALTAGEHAHQLLREQAIAAEAVAKLEAQRQEELVAQAAKETQRQAARAAREKRKLELRASRNRRSFTTVGGKLCSGFVLADEAEAALLEEADWAVFLGESGQVTRAVVVRKSRSGRISLEEIALALVSTPVSKVASRQNQPLKLTRFDMFRRPAGKRKEGKPDMVAYYVDRNGWEQLKLHRPEKPVNVVLEEGARFRLFTFHPDRIEDRGFVEKVVAKPRSIQVRMGVASNHSNHQYLSV